MAVGVNCTAPENVAPLLESAAGVKSPLAAYPNSGEAWNAAKQEWEGDACDSLDVDLWHQLGARLIGGCCRTSAIDIRRLRNALEAGVSARLL